MGGRREGARVCVEKVLVGRHMGDFRRLSLEWGGVVWAGRLVAGGRVVGFWSRELRVWSGMVAGLA